jgi:hypothetical protein
MNPDELREVCASLKEEQKRRTLFIRMQRAANQRIDAFIVDSILRLAPQDGRTIKESFDLARKVRLAHARGKVLRGLEAVQAEIADIMGVHYEAARPWGTLRESAENEMTEAARRLPIAHMVENVKGLGYLGLAIIVAEAGDIGAYANVQNLFKRLGLGVFGDRRQGNPEGDGEEKRQGYIAHGYNPHRRSEIWTITHSLLMGQLRGAGDAGPGPYGAIYAAKKAEYAASERGWSPKHIDNAARRYAGKKLIRHLWRNWRAAMRGAVETQPAIIPLRKAG